MPRRAMYAPTSQEWLPIPRDSIGDVRLCVQQFRGGDPMRTIHMWRQGRGAFYA